MLARFAASSLVRAVLGIASVCGAIVACGNDAKDDAARFDQPPAAVVFGAQTQAIELEVDYARGAEPATGVVPGVGADAWALFSTNATRIFAKASPRSIKVPSTVAEMEALDDVTGETFTESQIL